MFTNSDLVADGKPKTNIVPFESIEKIWQGSFKTGKKKTHSVKYGLKRAFTHHQRKDTSDMNYKSLGDIFQEINDEFSIGAGSVYDFFSYAAVGFVGAGFLYD